MYSTAYNLWTFTWIVHFQLPFRLKGTEKIHTERFSKFPSNIYFILFGSNAAFNNTLKKLYFQNKIKYYWEKYAALLLKKYFTYMKMKMRLTRFIQTLKEAFRNCLSIMIIDTWNMWIHIFLEHEYIWKSKKLKKDIFS